MATERWRPIPSMSASEREIEEAFNAFIDPAREKGVRSGLRAALAAAASVRAEAGAGAGPTPEAGAPSVRYWICTACKRRHSSDEDHHGQNEWQCPDCGGSSIPADPPPQPPAPAKSGYVRYQSNEGAFVCEPAPAEGGTDVAELIKELYERWDEDNEAGHGGRTHLCKRAADAITAQVAEIEHWKAALDNSEEHFRRYIEMSKAALAAKEAECETLKRERREHAGEVLLAHKRIAALEAALRLFDEFAWTAISADCKESRDELNRRVKVARATLKGEVPTR